MAYDKRDYKDYYSSDDDSIEDEFEEDEVINQEIGMSGSMWSEDLYFEFKKIAYDMGIEFFDFLSPSDLLDFYSSTL
jgi:hypothetical protein